MENKALKMVMGILQPKAEEEVLIASQCRICGAWTNHGRPFCVSARHGTVVVSLISQPQMHFPETPGRPSTKRRRARTAHFQSNLIISIWPQKPIGSVCCGCCCFLLPSNLIIRAGQHLHIDEDLTHMMKNGAKFSSFNPDSTH